MLSHRYAFALLLGAALPLPAQERAPTPQRLADSVLARFARRDTIGYGRLDPAGPARELLRAAWRDSLPARGVLATVLRSSRDSATLFLGGHVVLNNSGDDLSASASFTGLYRAGRAAGGWTLGAQIPFGAMTTIRSHRLLVTLRPDSGLDVIDTMRVTVRGRDGMAFRLNHRAAGLRIIHRGRALHPVAASGVVWVDLPPTAGATLIVSYTIDVAGERAKSKNSSFFGPRFGHVRNQFFWHPMLWFDDAASFRITLRAPAAVQVATDLPQQETVRDGIRIIEATSHRPVAAVTVAYDADWRPVHQRVGAGSFTAWVTPDFLPAPDTLSAAVRRMSDLLTARFGEATGSGSLAVVQHRGRGAGGWPFMSNNAIAAGTVGGGLDTGGDRPRAFFAHEVAHGWTRPTGAALNFLSEGWATFVEPLWLEPRHGADVVRRFWASQRRWYLDNGFDGKTSLLTDPRNGGVSYHKGAWVLRMLEDEMGRDAFDRGMRAYMAIPSGAPAGYPEFLAAMRAVATTDPTPFLTPWVEGTRIPEFVGTLRDGAVVIEQRQGAPYFDITLALRLVDGADTLRLSPRVRGAESVVPLPAVWTARTAAVLTIDPDERVLKK